MEIEAKYALTGPVEPSDIETLAMDPYHLSAQGEERHTDVLLDTQTRALTSQGHAVRLRHRNGDDGHVIATYKGPNAGVEGVHERDEIEASLSKPVPEDYHQWSPEFAARVDPLVHAAPLEPLVETEIRRRTWRVRRGRQTIAELALDEGSIQANGRTAPVHELEIEIKGQGTKADLEALRQVLTTHLPLRPEPHSKLERGLALFERSRVREAHRPLEEFARNAVRKQLKKLHKHEPVVREGKDPEGIHKMRVAARRLRTTLQILEAAPIFDQNELQGYRRGLKRLARTLGEVRDTDVFLARVEQYVETQPELTDDLDVLRKWLTERRQSGYTQLLKLLDSSKLARTFDGLAAFSHQPEEHVADQLPPLLVRHFAGNAILARYEGVMRYELVVQGAPPPTLHQLRIACKQTRYAIELFDGALGKRARPLDETLVRAQDTLGQFHDAVVAHDEVQRLAEQVPSNTGLATYAVALAAERESLRITFDPIWQELSGQPFHEELAILLGRL